MLQRCAKLENGIITQKKSERLPSADVVMSEAMLELLFVDRSDGDAATAEPTVEKVREHERRKPTGRNPLPEHLARVEVELIPDIMKQEGFDAFERIGEESSEHIDRIPACSMVVVVRRPKFVRKDRERNGATTVYIAEPHDLPIARGLAGPGMLADTLVRRWQDHMPLNRLEDMYGREGLQLARSTICGWHEQLVESVEPLIAAMREDAFAQPYLCTDATGVLVQAKEQCRRGHFWVIVAPGKHVLFEYTRDHTNAAVDGILADYEGYLVADAHAVYDHLYADGRAIEVNCWAHYLESVAIRCASTVRLTFRVRPAFALQIIARMRPGAETRSTADRLRGLARWSRAFRKLVDRSRTTRGVELHPPASELSRVSEPNRLHNATVLQITIDPR